MTVLGHKTAETSFCKKMLSKVEFFRQNFSNKTPKQKWLILFNFTSRTLELIGLRFMNDGTIYWRSYVPGLSLVAYCLLLSYTVIYHLSSSNFKELLYPICVVGICVSVSITILNNDDLIK